MIDIGVNLASKKFKESGYSIDQILQFSHDVGITGMIVISNSLKEAQENNEIINKHHPINMWMTIGVHPHDANSVASEKTLTSVIEGRLKNKKIVAIGECGLDYNRNFSPKQKQIEVFTYQILLAKKHNLPLYLHERDAHDDFVKILTDHNYTKGVVHCFTGNYDHLMVYLSMGMYIGVTGWICDTRRNHDLYSALRRVPRDLLLSRIMFETDAPFLKPPEYSQKINYPDALIYVIEKVSKMLDVPFDELVAISTNNVHKLMMNKD